MKIEKKFYLYSSTFTDIQYLIFTKSFIISMLGDKGEVVYCKYLIASFGEALGLLCLKQPYIIRH